MVYSKIIDVINEEIFLDIHSDNVYIEVSLIMRNNVDYSKHEHVLV